MKNHRAPWTRGTCRRLLALAVSASVVLIGVPASAWATEQIEGSESTVSKVQAPASQTAPTDSSSQADASDNGMGVSASNSSDSENATTENTQSTGSGEPTASSSLPSQASPSDSNKIAQPQRLPRMAPATKSLSDVWVNADSGSDDNAGTSADAPLASLKAGLNALGDGGTLHIAGTFTTGTPLTIPSGAHLDVYSDATFTGSNGQNGIILSAGAKLGASHGAKLTMSGFATALDIASGAEVNDGIYILDRNAIAFNLKGKFNGSSREALTVSALESTGRAFTYGKGSSFNNCTVNVQAKDEKSEQYAPLVMNNASLTTRGVWYYLNPEKDTYSLDLNNSDLYVYKATGSSAYKQTMAIFGQLRIVNGSTLTSDGSRISQGDHSTMEVTDSTMVFKNSTAGGYNINYENSNATFTNSTLVGENLRYIPLFGAGRNNPEGQFIKFVGNSVVNTAAVDKTADNGGANAPAQYVVTGGSFKIAYDPTYNYNVTTPTNGAENGNERLSLLTLADSSTNVLNPKNINGDRYTYNVARASDDGLKHVWVPSAKVTYVLNNSNASFADGSKQSKTATTIRGYALDMIAGNVDPGTPTDANGVKFLGWFYRDDAGAEHEFDASSAVDTNLEVYAKWNAASVIYHNNNGGTNFVSAVAPSAQSATVLDFDSISAQDSTFAVPGKTFKHWTTDPAGQGKPIAPGETLPITGASSIDLYAQYDVNLYQVAFSANGGRFSDDSVFKTNPDVFTVITDPNGGDVAVLKKKAEYGDEFRSLLGALDYNTLVPDQKAQKNGWILGDTTNWYTTPTGGKKYNFKDRKSWLFSRPGDNPQITKDMTFYLGWKEDPKVDKIENDAEIPGDIWGVNPAESSKEQFVRVGDTFSVTGVINADSIKDQMNAIESMFPQVTSSNRSAVMMDRSANSENLKLSQIALTSPTSTFTATLTMPEGVTIPESPQVTPAGLGDAFEVTDVKVDDRDITVTLSLKAGMTDYAKLKAAVESVTPMADGGLTLTVNGLGIDGDKVANGDKLTISGKVTGSFSAVATSPGGTSKHFKFTWNAVQDGSTGDPNSSNVKAIEYTLVVVKPYLGILPADIRVGKETQHNAAYPVRRGESLDFVGAVNVEPIKKQMKEIEALYPGGTDYEKLGIQVRNFAFEATFTIPEGLSLPAEVTPQALDFGEGFKVEETSVHGRTLTVKMTLNKDVTNYAQLQKIVMDAGAKDHWMKMLIPGVTVNSDAPAGKQLTLFGEVTGAFEATATSEAGTAKEFNFSWGAEQWPDGRDAVADASDKSIRFTVITPEQALLPADILVNGDTENSAIHMTKRGSELNFSADLDVSVIQKKMEEIEKSNNVPAEHFDRVMVKRIESEFTTRISVPEELRAVWPKDKASYALTGTDAFEISDVAYADGVITLSMKLKGDYPTYKALRQAIHDDTKSSLILTVAGFKVPDTAPLDQNITVSGEVSGYMKALATVEGGRSASFSMEWVSVQKEGGRDKILEGTDSSAVQLTLKVTKDPAVIDVKPPSPAKLPKTGAAHIGLSLYVSLAFLVAGGTMVASQRRTRKEFN